MPQPAVLLVEHEEGAVPGHGQLGQGDEPQSQLVRSGGGEDCLPA